MPSTCACISWLSEAADSIEHSVLHKQLQTSCLARDLQSTVRHQAAIAIRLLCTRSINIVSANGALLTMWQPYRHRCFADLAYRACHGQDLGLLIPWYTRRDAKRSDTVFIIVIH